MPIASPRILRRLITNVPLRWALTVPFVLSTVGATALVGYLSYRSGQAAVKDLGQKLVAQTNDRVTQELKTYLQTPVLITRLNVDAANQGQLDPRNVPALESALFNRLQQFDQVSAILFVSPQGRFRVVERLPELYLGVADPPDPSKVLIYRLDSQGRRQQLVYTENDLDVRRDRSWYQRAVTTGQLGWSPISQYGTFKALTLDASQPIYDRTTNRLLGVFAVHLRLDYLSEFLQRLNISSAGQILIMDQSGNLIATSTGEQPYRVAAGAGSRGQVQQLNINQSQNALTRSLGEYLRDRPDELKSLGQTQSLEFSYGGELQYVQVTPFQDQYGLNWRILTVIPQSHFLGAIQNSTRTTMLLCLLTLSVAIALGLLAANQLTARFAQLNRASRELAAGNLDRRLLINSPIDEVNGLAQTFNQMADRLQSSFDRLKIALTASEEKFAVIFHASPDSIALATLSGERIVEANQSFLDLLEYSREELIGQPLLNLGIWSDLDSRAQFREALQQNGFVRNLEVVSRTQTDRIKTVLVSAEFIEINGEAYVLGIGRDISDRKQTEEQLRKTEQWLYHYSQLSPGVIYTLVQEPDGHTWFEYMSSAIEVIHEVTLEQVYQDANLLLNSIHPDDQAGYQNAVLESMQSLNPFCHQWRIITPSGQIKWILGNSQPERRKHGAIAWHGVVTDISDRKRTEAALRNSETLNGAILNALPDLIVRMHRDGTYLDIKHTAAFPTGLPNFRVGENIRNILPPEVAQQRLEAAITALQTGEIQVYEFPLWVQEQHLWQEVRIMPLNSDEVIVVIRDLTQRKQIEQVLRESEVRLLTAQRVAQMGSWEVDLATQKITWSETLFHIVGFDSDRSEPSRTGLREIIPAEDLDRLETAVDRAIETGTSYEIEHRICRPNGAIRYVISKGQAALNDQQQAFKLYGTVLDITERKQAEIALQESETRFQEIAQTLNQVSYVISVATGQYLYISPAYERLWGYSCESLYQNPNSWLDRIHPEDLEYVLQVMNQLFSGRQVRMEYRILCANGEVRWIQSESLAVYDEDGDPVRVVGLADDITDRKRAGEALRQSEERFREIAETVNDIFYIFSADLRTLLYVSPAYETITGYVCEKLYEDQEFWEKSMHPDDRAIVNQNWASMSVGGEFRAEYRTVRSNGEMCWIKDRAFPIYGDDGQVLRVIGIAEDITERKQLEQTLRSQAEEEHLRATITQNMRQSLDLEQILATTVIDVQQTLKADRALIFRLNSDGSGQVIQEAVVPAYPMTDQMRWEDEHFSADCYEYYRQGNSRIVPDVATDEWAGCLAEFLQTVGVKSKVVAPIVQTCGKSSVVWGLLVVHACSDYRQWQESEANLLQKICSQLAIAIDQANLYQQLQTELAERKQAEAALQEREAMLRAIGDNLPKGFIYQRVYEPGKGSHYSYISAGVERLLGIKPEAILANPKAMRTVGFDEDLALADRAAQESLKNLSPIEIQMRNRTAQGEIQWSSIRSVPRRLPDGRTVWDGVEVDITELKRIEAALRASEEQFRNAFDGAPIGVSLVSPTGQFLKANSSYCDLVGYTEAELLKLSFQDITHPADLDMDLGGFRQMMTGEIRSYQLEKRYITKQGTVVPVLINAAPIRDQDGNPIYVVGHIQDIRDRLKIERIKNEFISVVSHELRTPLTSIRGALGILGSGVFDDRPAKAQHMLNIAINNSDRLVNLVDDILTLERLESGKVQLVMEQCQIADLMQEAVDSVQAIADQSAVTLSFTPLYEPLWAASSAIIQTLINLLSNAIKFSAPGDTVWLKAEFINWESKMENGKALSDAPTSDAPTSDAPTSDASTSDISTSNLRLSTPAMLFSVKDQGRGIPNDKLEVIFEQFQQVDVSDSREKGGTGLGLAICKKIVQQHGGQIWAESSLGEGSTFYFALPLIMKDEK